jgi:hypothetical protein
MNDSVRFLCSLKDRMRHCRQVPIVTYLVDDCRP